MFPRLFAPAALLLSLSLFAPAAEVLQVKGSALAAAPLIAAAPKLKELGIELKIDAEQNTSNAIALLGAGQADIALATRAVNASERAAYPHLTLEASPIGYQIVALVVSLDVWASGVRALTREQVRRIYEGEITNWKEVGGEDRPLKFFNPEQGHGVWETFAAWLYGDLRRAPLGEKFEAVTNGEETRNVVEFHAGSLSVVPPLWIDQRGTFALAVKTDEGELLQPTLAAARDAAYPLARRIDVLSGDRPSGSIKRVIDFMLGPEGREILKKSDYLPAQE